MESSIDNDYATGNLLDYEYFPKTFKLILTDVGKQKELENLYKTKKEYFIENIERDGGGKCFLL